jgi:glucosamine-6-phosphate deaminase
MFPSASKSLAGGDLPAYLTVPQEGLGANQPVKLRVLPDMETIARDMADTILGEIVSAAAKGRAATLILPVGPVDYLPVLATLINDQKVPCADLVLINMDEYLRNEREWVAADHPLSFRGYMDRVFYDRLNVDLAPRKENRIFPHPARLDELAALIAERGGVDACFGGIGINGHMAFNEPPEPGVGMSNEQFAALPSRVLELSRETRTINSVTVGGEITIIPKWAVTVGMKEILAARRLFFYCNRPWQSGVVRRALHGPLTSACPASFLRTHPDATLTVASYVAAAPDIRLR